MYQICKFSVPRRKKICKHCTQSGTRWCSVPNVTRRTSVLGPPIANSQAGAPARCCPPRPGSSRSRALCGSFPRQRHVSRPRGSGVISIPAGCDAAAAAAALPAARRVTYVRAQSHSGSIAARVVSCAAGSRLLARTFCPRLDESNTARVRAREWTTRGAIPLR